VEDVAFIFKLDLGASLVVGKDGVDLGDDRGEKFGGGIDDVGNNGEAVKKGVFGKVGAIGGFVVGKEFENNSFFEP